MNDDRDNLIFLGSQAGMKAVRLAYLFGLKPQRIKQIIREQQASQAQAFSINEESVKNLVYTMRELIPIGSIDCSKD